MQADVSYAAAADLDAYETIERMPLTVEVVGSAFDPAATTHAQRVTGDAPQDWLYPELPGHCARLQPDVFFGGVHAVQARSTAHSRVWAAFVVTGL
ncbi:MAG: hypothetical protein P8O03_02315 [Ilumatobacter sp.]|nr:hypothetical protein [Ilumatobacter sp.]NKB39747.1 hypothetical protein [Ilumatobacter sp.]